MEPPSFVAGDWGTSHLRLFLCDDQGTTLDSASGPGASAVKIPYADLFESLIKDWEARYGALPAVLCGMVGSSIGWVQTSYVACPANPESIIAGSIAVRAGRAHLLPGLRCRNRFNTADFMRGEETQILGALGLDATLRIGMHLLCLPGTHTKWVLLEEGVIKEFLTAATGEAFGVLRDHSVLVRAAATPGEPSSAAFEEGMQRFYEFPQAPLLHRLFECRSRVLSGEMAASHATDFLSGLLIACDVFGALNLFADAVAEHSVRLIGTPRLTQAYAKALKFKGYAATQLDGATAALAGLTRARHLLFARANFSAA